MADCTAAPALTPLERDALLNAYAAPDHVLVRRHGYFYAPDKPQGFTKRLVLRLQRNGLAELDDQFCPSRAVLTPAGIRVAETAAKGASRKVAA